MSDFQGDVLLIDDADGGELVINEGLISCDKAFSTAVYISLFGGNWQDSGKVKNGETWWGNNVLDTKENEKVVSRLQNVIKAMPLSTKNIGLAKQAALDDLAWLKDEGIVDEIIVGMRVVGVNTSMMQIECNKEDSRYRGEYSLQWQEGLYVV